MVAKEIKSLQHKLIKELVRLREEKKIREEKGLVLVSGNKMIKELSEVYEPELLLYVDICPKIKAKESIKVTKEILRKVTNVPSPEALVALFPLPKKALPKKGPYLILDQLKDPKNVGTLFRSALAFGFSGVLLTKGSTDPFHEHTLRASKGAVFHLPYAFMSENEVLAIKDLYVADIDGDDIDRISLPPSASLLLGSESHGASALFQKKCKRIKLPMKKNVESLSVSAAGSILLYLMRPK